MSPRKQKTNNCEKQLGSLAERLLSLGELSSLTSVNTPEHTLLALFVSKMHALFGAKAMAIWTTDLKNRTLVLRYGHELSPMVEKFAKTPAPFELFPEVRLAIESGSAWITENIDDAPLFENEETKKILQSMGAHAVMGIPLRALTEVFGAISIYYDEPRRFNVDDKAIALAYTISLALSLNNIGAFQKILAAERVKSEVISIVAHQFRTPIATLRGNVELLKEESIRNDANTFQQVIGELDKVGNKLRLFVDNFLNVKAIDEGVLQPKPARFDFNATLARVVRDMETFRVQHKIGVDFQQTNQAIYVTADETLVSEALINVINNAIKYAKSKASISTKIEGKEITVIVADDGVGIPEAEQGMIFQKLYRASNVARHPEASSGLGLYIAKQYIEANGGRIWFTSLGEGKGTIFYVAFPLTV